MIWQAGLEKQVDEEFGRARRKAYLRRMAAWLRKDPARHRLPSFDEATAMFGASNRTYLGSRTVKAEKIVGSVGRSQDFDRGFLPGKASLRTRWKRIDRAFHRGEYLPPVDLYKVGDAYFVLDGNHRVSVARFQGVGWMDAEVTEFHAGVPEDPNGADPRSRANAGTRPTGESNEKENETYG